jgi:hypothetical protein
MGYSTYFSGTLQFNKPVTEQLTEYINRFSATRRMPRDNEKIKAVYPNWRELCFFGDLGRKGEYFVPSDKNLWQDNDGTVLDINGYKEKVHPGLYCQWIINDNGELEWYGNEKFYNYEEWLVYLIDNFFKPLGYVLNGDIEWQGDDYSDLGTIHVVDNKVSMEYGIRASSIKDIDTKTLINELVSRGYKVAM